MKYIIAISFFIFQSISASYAQTYSVPKTPLLDSLYNWNTPISSISKSDINQQFIKNVVNSHFSQLLVKNHQGLFVLIDGTGQVYKATSQTIDQLSFTRIDSTIYYGYNFNAIDFSYHDTLYSYGGEGFWFTNGHLRYFNDGKDWNIIKLNGIYPTKNLLFNYLPDIGKLFFLKITYTNEYNQDTTKDYSIIELNLINNKNQLLGKFNNKLKEILDLNNLTFNVNAPDLKGIIKIDKQGNVLLLRFIDNTVYKLTNNKTFRNIFYNSTDHLCNLFQINGRIYGSSLNDQTVHSFPISMSDFQKEPYTLYEPISSINYIYFLFAGIIFLLVISILFRKNIKIFLLSKQIQTDKIEIHENSMDFNAIETSLIEKIIFKANKHELFSVTELNNTLGLNKKSLEIQKKIRTETINRINHKFQVKYNKETVFIERIRSEDDRRFYLYTISKENATVINQKKNIK